MQPKHPLGVTFKTSSSAARRMSRTQLTLEQIATIDALAADGLMPARIANATGLKYHTVYARTRRQQLLLERGFPTRTSYQRYLASRTVDESYIESQRHLRTLRRTQLLQSSMYLIRTRMEHLGLSKDQVAYDAGISKASVANYCSGRRTPSQETWEKLTSVLRLLPFISAYTASAD